MYIHITIHQSDLAVNHSDTKSQSDASIMAALAR